MPPRIALVTSFPSHYQVDLFNEIARADTVHLHVFYLRTMTPGRQWTVLRPIRHEHTFVPEFPQKKRFDVFYLNPGFLRSVKKFAPDICVITQYASVAMQLLMVNCIMRRQPWVFWSELAGVKYSEFHSASSEKWRLWLRRLALVPVRYATQIWGIGQLAMKQYQALTSTPCLNVPYFFEQTAFLSIPRTAVCSPIRFLFSGKLIRRKGIDILMEAVEALVQQGFKFEVVILGDGPERNYIERAPDQARSVIRFEGFHELDRVPQVYAACDVLVCPSRHDGWGMVVGEAMAAGMPVISTAQTGAAVDMLEDGENGFLLPALDTALLVQAMQSFIENPDTVLTMGIQAREMAKHFAAERGAELFVQNLLSLGTSKG
jgi:glycosyltransferase involved in cell wall biosynthesis